MCRFSRALFVNLSFFLRPFCCLFFVDLRILITPLVSSNSSCTRNKNTCKNDKSNFLAVFDKINYVGKSSSNINVIYGPNYLTKKSISIWNVCVLLLVVTFFFLSYNRTFEKINTTGVTSEPGTAHPYRIPKLASCFSQVRVAQCFVFYMDQNFILFHFVIVLYVLWFTASDYPFAIF